MSQAQPERQTPAAGSPLRFGLRMRSLVTVAAVVVVIGGVGLGSLFLVGGHIAQDMGFAFAEQYVLGHKARVQGFMERELTLARRLGDSAPLAAWARNEEDPDRRQKALAELAEFRALFASDSYFVVLAGSGHYYFAGEESGNGPRITQTLSREDEQDSWFYDTLASDKAFHVNVDRNKELQRTRVWFNVPIRDDGEVLGVAGTGVDISQFLRRFVDTDVPGLRAMLLNADGAIQAHPDRDRIALNTQVDQAGPERTLWGHIAGKGQRERAQKHMKQLRTGEENTATFPLTIDGRDRLVALTYLPKLEWYSLASLEPGALLGWSKLATLGGVLLMALILALLALGGLFNRFLLRPLLGLAAAAEDVAQGDYSRRLPEGRDDELGTVARSFNAMTRTVQSYTATLEERVQERTRELEAANAALDRTNQQLVESNESARRIQEALLPTQGPHPSLEHAARWWPRDQVGGDLHVLRPAADGLLVGVMDCTGHGVPGAVTAMAAHAAFSHAVDRGADPRSPAAVLTALNNEVRTMLNPRGADGTRGEDNGLEMGLCRWEPDTGILRFAAARIALFRLGSDGVTEWPGDSAGLGYWRGDAVHRFTEHIIPAEHEASFLLATDGLLDQPGGPKGLPFGRQRFRSLLEGVTDRPLPEQMEAVDRSLAEWQGDQPQRDDITVVGFRPLFGGSGDQGR